MLRVPLVAEVLILRKSRQLAEPFDYLIPDKLQEKAKPGLLVRVPLRNSESLGLITNLKESSDFNDLKPISEILESLPVMSEVHLKLLQWMSEYYIESAGAVASLFFPSLLSSALEKRVALLTSEAPKELYTFIALGGGSVKYIELVKHFGKLKTDKLLKEAQSNESVKIFWSFKRTGLKPKVTYEIHLADAEEIEHLKKITRSRRFKAFFTELKSNISMSLEEARDSFGIKLSELKRIESSGAIRLVEKFIDRPVVREVDVYEKGVELNEEQKVAIKEIEKAIDRSAYKEFLIFGPTGSGKTEVYLRSAAYALKKGKGVIYLVPEISLTPQTYTRIERRFPGKTAVFHSSLKESERLNQWYMLAEKAKQIVVGARSALFMPVSNIGLIIIDEEHDTSYRQDSSPVYDARRVARKMAELSGAVLIYGSATPSLERMYEAKNGKIELLKLSHRVSGRMPEIEVIDLKRHREFLTDVLKEELTKTIEKGNKALIFLNRRGYSVVEICSNCGYLATCPRCTVFLRFHRDTKKLTCHYCGYSRKPDESCPDCGSLKISLKGRGIQQIEEQIKEIVKDKVKVVRLDSDVARRGEGKDNLFDFISGDASILVGTQMVAKGLHLPEITFAGIVNADAGLNMPDFRAEERTFQLIVQLAGRVGRGDEQGKVLVQSFQPERQVIQYAVNGDYEAFYKREIEMRLINELPPFKFLIRVLTQSKNEKEAIEVAEKVYKNLKESLEKDIKIIGPLPAPLYKLHGRYRVQILLKLDSEPTKNTLDSIRRCANIRSSAAKVKIDVDPVVLI
ncbi:MAG: primosomal protein N' [Actinobacteria bacterium]|nr:primosomal protein N' [Actinomycetota bacterium]